MIPVTQDRFVAIHGYGNCMNSVIASLLERQLEEVADIRPTDPQWWHNWKRWLKTEGYYLGLRSKNDPPPGYAIMVVTTDRIFPEDHPKAGELITHTCVCLDGIFIHDPYPNASEVRNLLYYYEVVPLDQVDDPDD